MLIRNDTVVDISLTRADEGDSKELFVRQGVKQSAGLARRNGINGGLRFCYPSILKNDAEIRMAHEEFEEEGIEFHGTPLSTVHSIARMSEDTLMYPCFDDYEEPVCLYTDASVQKQNGMPTVGTVMVDDENHLLAMHGEILDAHYEVSVSELEAGFIGLEMAADLGVDEIVWVSDNHDAQAVFSDSGTSEICNNRRDQVAKSIRSRFDSFRQKDINGSDNILADSLAGDMRRDDIPETLTYESDAL